ncbi:MAG: hypothetical protein ABI877_11600 [Gemmatimonadaceae bacterium]
MKNLTMLRATMLGVVVSSAPLNARLGAQITEIARTPIADAAQITFGYLCDDRFVIRNDGTKPIDLEYGLEKGNEHTKLTLNARESVELASKSKDPVELWMDSKLIAKAIKEKRSCKQVQGNASVTVNPLTVASNTPMRAGYGYGPQYPFYDPWYFGFYGSPFGFRPYYSGLVGYPIIVGHRGHGRRGR